MKALLKLFLASKFTELVTTPLTGFTRIPNQSRDFLTPSQNDPLLLKACEFCISHADSLAFKDYKSELLNSEGHTPAVFVSIGRVSLSTVLIYGHLDKQPPMAGQWGEGLGPFEPVVRKNKLYGRGTADDGYAFFASLAIVKALQKTGELKYRFVLFFETDEESDSKDLNFWLDQKKEEIGQPEIVLCLDSGTNDFEHLSLTTSLRGLVNFKMTVKTHDKPYHSGLAGGLLPDPFMIGTQILSQLEKRLSASLDRPIPKEQLQSAIDLVKEFGLISYGVTPLKGGKYLSEDPLELYLNRNHRPSFTVIGVEGLPKPDEAGNVLNNKIGFAYSVRLPPSLDYKDAEEEVNSFFRNLQVPYNAKVTNNLYSNANGMYIQLKSQSLKKKIEESARIFFGKRVLYAGEGGSLSIINDFTKRFPNAEILVTGVLGPGANVHSPNENLDLDYTLKLMLTLANIFS